MIVITLFNDNLYIETFPRRILKHVILHVAREIKGKLSELLCHIFLPLRGFSLWDVV